MPQKVKKRRKIQTEDGVSVHFKSLSFIIFLTDADSIGGVMVGMLSSSAVDHRWCNGWHALL